jgi:3-oxoacyl-[acyl-carrier-protein] synthase II
MDRGVVVMDNSTRRAVITGAGVYSPIGSDLPTFWQSLIDARSGIRPIQHMDASDLPCRIVGDVLNFDPKKVVLDREHRKNLGRMMARTVQLGVAVAQVAINDVAMPKGHLDPTRFGVEFGAAMIHTELDDIARAAKVSSNCLPDSVSLTTWGQTGMKEIPPLWMLKYLPNMPACHVAIMHDIQGPSNTITLGDVSSLLALGEGWRILQRDLVDFVLVGGTDSKLNALNYARQSLFQPLTKRNDIPARALRPFDRDRDGTVLAEGAAAFGLEELEHAQKRGAKIYAEVVGFASGFDRQKEGKIFAKVMRKALAEAGIAPAEVDHINAHGVGTVESDLWEAKAIHEVFGTATPVWSIKGNIGTIGPGGSVVELLASILAFQHGQLPPTLNCDNRDPGCEIMVPREIRPTAKPYALKLSFTDLGQVAALVIKKWDR